MGRFSRRDLAELPQVRQPLIRHVCLEKSKLFSESRSLPFGMAGNSAVRSPLWRMRYRGFAATRTSCSSVPCIAVLPRYVGLCRLSVGVCTCTEPLRLFAHRWIQQHHYVVPRSTARAAEAHRDFSLECPVSCCRFSRRLCIGNPTSRFTATHAAVTQFNAMRRFTDCVVDSGPRHRPTP